MKGSKFPTIKIGGREIPLYYSSYELIEIQESIGCTAFQLNEEVFGIHREDPDNDDSPIQFEVITNPEKTRKLGILIRILGNAGLEEEGKEPDLTDKWVLRNMKPGMIMMYVISVIPVLTEGNKIESTDEPGSSGPVDEVLEEQNAKKQPGN